MSYKSLHFRCYAVLDGAPLRGVRGKIFIIVDPCDGFLGVVPHILEFLDKCILLPVGLSLKATRRCSVIGILALFCYIICYFGTILVHGSFDDSSHFVHVNINILTHTTSWLPVLAPTELPHVFI